MATDEETAAPLEPLSERYRRLVGEAAVTRDPPRLAAAVAAAGAVLAGIGVIVLGAEMVSGGTPRAVAALVAAVYGVGGFALLSRGTGPQRSAGAAAVAIAVPVAFGFLILSQSSFDGTEPATVLAVSAVIWGFLHLAGPGRGRPVFLAAALAGAWLTIVVAVGIDVVPGVVPVGGPAPFEGSAGTGDVVLLSLLFGVAYLVGAFGLDRAGLRGTATVFLGVAIPAIASGVSLGAQSRPAWVGALLLLGAGATVGFVGARLGRRLSTWLGAATFGGGLFVAVGAAVPGDQTTAAGVILVAVGAAAALATPVLADALGEGSGPVPAAARPEDAAVADDPAPPPAAAVPRPRARQRPLKAR